MKIYLILLKIFILSALLIVSNNNLALKEADSRDDFINLYHVWVSDFFDKAVYVTGYVVKSDWLPDANLTENREIKNKDKR